MLRFVIDEEHPEGHALPSYCVQDAHLASSPYTRMWITTVDAPFSASGSSHETDHNSSAPAQERFVLYTALSLARAEVLRGRATRIWLAWKFEDMEKDQKDRKVFRHCLRLQPLVELTLDRFMSSRTLGETSGEGSKGIITAKVLASQSFTRIASFESTGGETIPSISFAEGSDHPRTVRC